METQKPKDGGNRRMMIWVVTGLLGAVIGAKIAMRATGPAPSEGVLERMAKSGFTPAVLASIALWFVLSVYWEIARRNDTTERESGASRGVHVFLTAAAQILVLFPVPFLRTRFLPPALWVSAAGLALEAAGLWLAIWARRVLGRNWSGAIASNVDHELVQAGPYRSIRHPIYTGVLAMYVGAAIVSGQLHALLGVLFAIVAYARKIPMEEAHMRRHFGAAYDEYSKRSRALLPGIF